VYRVRVYGGPKVKYQYRPNFTAALPIDFMIHSVGSWVGLYKNIGLPIDVMLCSRMEFSGTAGATFGFQKSN